MAEKYEAVVVGAGVGGLAAAYELARNGVQTLVLERGKTPGRKNVTGGILYGQTNTEHNIDYLFPDFEKEAPVERPIHRYEMFALSGHKAAKLDLRNLHEHEMKYAYSILRVPFDEWLADKVHKEARKHGGGILSGIRVTGPAVENGKIVGVKTNELEDIHADVVIAADGATSELVRGAGLRDWGRPEEWFQGAKAVVKVPDLESRFGLSGADDGVAYLYAGDVFGGARGGGFLYTNKDTLSIGTVFHLDALARAKRSPHEHLDALLKHPVLANVLGEDYEEVEYSAKLIPDGKKMRMRAYHKDRLLAIGDAAGAMQAQGPVIKGLNLAISGGIMAAQAFLYAKERGNTEQAGASYERALRASYVHKDLNPLRYRTLGKLAETGPMNALATVMTKSPLGRGWLKSSKRATKLFGSPFLAGAMPDTELGYVTMPTLVAELQGEEVPVKAKIETKSLEQRIADLKYDTAIGKPHILLQNNSPAASGLAVNTCPVSAPGFSGGCYRIEKVQTPDGGAKDVVALDTQPCIECGTCALMADTKWEHPPGGKGVDYRFG